VLDAGTKKNEIKILCARIVSRIVCRDVGGRVVFFCGRVLQYPNVS